jgi:hypothetical protein
MLQRVRLASPTGTSSCKRQHKPSFTSQAPRPGVRYQFHHVIDIVPTILEVTGIPRPRDVLGSQYAYYYMAVRWACIRLQVDQASVCPLYPCPLSTNKRYFLCSDADRP